jgi:hypothetical protein
MNIPNATMQKLEKTSNSEMNKQIEAEGAKTCFVIMPISDVDGYPTGHFKRVYEFLIKPACKLAGFEPIRADDILNTNYIALDIVKQIINADMALCDLSSRNPNVLYELGIRQAFNKPVTLIKDTVTVRIFDISGFRDVEYDESLRIDTTQSGVPLIAETIKNTYESQGSEINSLIGLLGIEPAKIEKNVIISTDTALLYDLMSHIQNQIKGIENTISASVAAQLTKKEVEGHVYKQNGLKMGDTISHEKFGKGVLLNIEGSIHNPVVTIKFDKDGDKKLMLNYLKFTKEDDDLPF